MEKENLQKISKPISKKQSKAKQTNKQKQLIKRKINKLNENEWKGIFFVHQSCVQPISCE